MFWGAMKHAMDMGFSRCVKDRCGRAGFIPLCLSVRPKIGFSAQTLVCHETYTQCILVQNTDQICFSEASLLPF